MSLYLCGVIRCVCVVCLEGVKVYQIGGRYGGGGLVEADA
jgi:hypothetical protein